MIFDDEKRINLLVMLLVKGMEKRILRHKHWFFGSIVILLISSVNGCGDNNRKSGVTSRPKKRIGRSTSSKSLQKKNPEFSKKKNIRSKPSSLKLTKTRSISKDLSSNNTQHSPNQSFQSQRSHHSKKISKLSQQNSDGKMEESDVNEETHTRSPSRISNRRKPSRRLSVSSKGSLGGEELNNLGQNEVISDENKEPTPQPPMISTHSRKPSQKNVVNMKNKKQKKNRKKSKKPKPNGTHGKPNKIKIKDRTPTPPPPKSRTQSLQPRTPISKPPKLLMGTPVPPKTTHLKVGRISIRGRKGIQSSLTKNMLTPLPVISTKWDDGPMSFPDVDVTKLMPKRKQKPTIIKRKILLQRLIPSTKPLTDPDIQIEFTRLKDALKNYIESMKTDFSKLKSMNDLRKNGGWLNIEDVNADKGVYTCVKEILHECETALNKAMKWKKKLDKKSISNDVDFYRVLSLVEEILELITETRRIFMGISRANEVTDPSEKVLCIETAQMSLREQTFPKILQQLEKLFKNNSKELTETEKVTIYNKLNPIYLYWAKNLSMHNQELKNIVKNLDKQTASDRISGIQADARFRSNVARLLATWIKKTKDPNISFQQKKETIENCNKAIRAKRNL